MSGLAVRGIMQGSAKYMGKAASTLGSKARNVYSAVRNDGQVSSAIGTAGNTVRDATNTSIATGITMGVESAIKGVGNGFSFLAKKIGMKGGNEDEINYGGELDNDDELFSQPNKKMGGGSMFQIIKLMFIVITLLFAFYIVKTQYSTLFGSSKMTNSVQWANGRSYIRS